MSTPLIKPHRWQHLWGRWRDEEKAYVSDGIIGNFLQSHRAAFSLMKGPREKEKKEDIERSEQVESHYDGQHEIRNKRNWTRLQLGTVDVKTSGMQIHAADEESLRPRNPLHVRPEIARRGRSEKFPFFTDCWSIRKSVAKLSKKQVDREKETHTSKSATTEGRDVHDHATSSQEEILLFWNQQTKKIFSSSSRWCPNFFFG